MFMEWASQQVPLECFLFVGFYLEGIATVPWWRELILVEYVHELQLMKGLYKVMVKNNQYEMWISYVGK